MQDIHREEDDVQQAMVVPGIADQADNRTSDGRHIPGIQYQVTAWS